MARNEKLVLDIEGMTCSSCVARVEKGLNAVPGVQASVNLMTNSASVEFPPAVTTDQLLTAVRQLGYEAHVSVPVSERESDSPNSDSHARMLSLRLWIAVALTVPVISFAMVPAWQFVGWQWVSLALATPVVVWCAWPIHRSTFLALRHGSLTMDTLITMGTAAAYFWSVYALFFGMAGMLGMRHSFEFFAWQQDPTANIYLETAAGVATFILLGRWLEERSKRTAASALDEVGRLQATEATVVRGDVESRIPVAELRVGDRVIVRPGESIPVDGPIVEGHSAIDASALTGESIPDDVGIGDNVVAGTIVLDGRLSIHAERVRDDTRLAQLAALVEQAQLRKMSLQRLADRISAVFVPIVLGLAVVTFVAWLLVGQPLPAAFTAAVAVLVIACPCALGLATPVALIVGTGRAAKLGIIISGPEVLEQSSALDTIVLDKTGTITSGEMSVVAVHVSAGVTEQDVLAKAAAVESGSEHPIARAILRHGSDSTLSSTGFRAVPGGGASATVSAPGNSMPVRVGKLEWLRANGSTVSTELERMALSEATAGHTIVGVAWEGEVRGLVSVADTVRPDSLVAIARLRAQGLDPIMVTGDAPETAQAIAASVNVSRIESRVSPEGKVAFISALQSQGHRVAMVGDGINDAAALAQADIGIAFGSGTDLAIMASDITLVRATLDAAADAIAISRRTLRIIRGNLFWAFAYNVVMIPLAAAGFLNPMLAGAAMAFSSLFVVLNSLRLRVGSLKP